MNIRRLFWVGVGLVVTALAVVSLRPLLTQDQAQAQTVNFAGLSQCPTGLTTNITNGATLTGMTPINLGAPTTITSFVINKVMFRLDNAKTLGQARPAGTNAWNMIWATQLTAPGAHQLTAVVLYNGTSSCQTAPLAVNIAPSVTGASFNAVVNPPNANVPTNTSIDFIATPSTNTPLLATDLAQFVVYEWSTSIGTLQTTQGGARLNSGGTAGTGALRMKASYGGQEVIRDMPVQVNSQLAPTGTTPPPSGGTTSGGTTTLPTTTTTTNPAGGTTTSPTTAPAPLTPEQKIQLIATQLAAQPEILDCANLNLSPARIEQLRTSGLRLDQQEFQRIKGCFAQQNFIVPSSYAPVAPDDVRTNTVKQDVGTRIVNASTPQPTADKPKALRFQGQAEPDSDVLLYVFSEPLVLYAKADSEGNWVYDLVDPLVPGSHEAYAVVEAEDGTYKKSSAFSFLIQTAEASAENPNGYSLSVETVASLNPQASKQGINMYVVASFVMVGLVMGVGGFILFKTMRRIPPDDGATPEGPTV